GRVVLVTGGSRGLGLVVSRELARKGARIATCARGERALRRAREDLRARGAEVLTVTCDVRVPGAAERLIDTPVRHFGRPDELAPAGICVTTVLPGMMRTGSFVNALFKGQREREVTWFSLGGALPLVSISAERAARRILRACELGERFVTLGLPAQVLRLAHA